MSLGYESPSLLYRTIDELGNNRLFSFVYKHYIKTLDIKENYNVLDFGSGSGAGSRHLAGMLTRLNGHLTCVDISEYWMQKARKRMKKYDNVDYLVGELRNFKFKEKSFDVVYIFYALHDVSHELRNEIVNEFFRVLKDGGRLYIKEPQRKDDGISVEEIKELMKNNNFFEETSREHKGKYSAVYRKLVADKKYV